MRDSDILLLGVADTVSKEISSSAYTNLPINEKSFVLANQSLNKLSDYLKLTRNNLEQLVTDLISIPPSNPYSDFGYTIKLAYNLGLTGIEPHTIDNEGSSVGGAISLASRLIRENLDRFVLISAGDAPKSGLTKISDIQMVTKVTTHREWETPYGPTLIGLYGIMAKRLMYENHITQKDFEDITRYFRSCAINNPRAVNYEKEITSKSISKMVCSPYSTPMIAIVSDHGFSTILVSGKKYKELLNSRIIEPSSEPVKVSGYANVFYSEFLSQRKSLESPSKLSGKLAFKRAGLRPQDIDYAWIYDCFIGMIIKQASNFFNISVGDVTRSLAKGEITVDNKKIPINRGGGILNYQASMAISGASGLIDVMSAFNLTPNPIHNYNGNIKHAFMSGNGGIDSVNSVVIFSELSHEIKYQHLDENSIIREAKKYFPLNKPDFEEAEGILYSYTVIGFNPGGEKRSPYVLALVKTKNQNFVLCNIQKPSGELLKSDENLEIEKTP
ncbi:MAG: thiolase family protein, partial [Leptospiraceae bacterium]|nr:thiolase family protein [Leptospiraceae bacterium]